MAHASARASAPTEVVIADRYRVDQLLGEGGMGAVYRVVDVASGKRLALKRLSAGASAGTAALFEREYHTLAGLKHPSIVEVYDYGSDADGAFYTMELIEGSDLSKAAPMAWREACRHLRDVASLLGLLHARRLLHRDLSPRNLLRNQSGKLKLIDFGALAPFGTNREIVGTPPFVAPEALRTLPLDQRTDLFGLGALGYWLVTGSHAFPARSLGELPSLWEHEPAAPSEMLALLERNDLDAIPAELDALLTSMLRSEPTERLASTSELIDRLNSIADLEPEAHAMAVQGYLDSKAFVGRVRERERALTLLKEADRGQVQTLVVEGDAGVGRTRFLQELVVVSRLAGALPVIADRDLGGRPYGVAESLLLGLVRSLPERTREVVASHSVLLGNISKELREALRLPVSAALVHAPAELRVRMLAALRDVFCALSSERLLCLFIDDVQAIDEETQALLTALAHAERGPRLLIVAALGREARREESAALTHLRGQAARIQLLPLTVSELLDLLRSVFGQVPYLERLADRLHRASEGNPAYCLELAQHLVHSGLATYQDGTWSLPPELARDSLPKSRQEAHLAQLLLLSDDARKLARSLSVPDSAALSLDQCFAVSDLPPARVHELLADLTRLNVLRVGNDGYRFAHSDVQTTLCAELSSADRATSHLRLAEEIAATQPTEVMEQLRAALHFVRAGDRTRCHQMMSLVSQHYRDGKSATLSTSAPLIEEVYLALKQHGEDQYGLLNTLSMLALAGYFADRYYANRYGDIAIAALQDALRMTLARRLSRFLGQKLGLLVALVIAGFALKRRRGRAPDLKHAITQLVAGSAALAGTAALSLDGDKAQRYADGIRVFTALGDDHAVTFAYKFARFAALSRRDQPAHVTTELRAFLARLELPGPIAGMWQNVRDGYTGGSLLMLGAISSWRDDPECLEIADRLEHFSPLHAMGADQVRASYYGGQGNSERAAHFAKRMEVHAVQLGNAWQLETWGPADTFKIAVRTNNAAIMKRAQQEFTRLRSELPALELFERQARGTYLVLRNKFELAIPLLDTEEEPASRAGWARTRGLLARAYNGLGQHERARAICVDALQYLSPDDRLYVITNMNVQIELALSELGLGHVSIAKEQLDKLLLLHAPNQSAITLGSLHDARARVALAESAFAEAREHLAQMETHYRTTGIATLIELVATLRRDIDHGENPRDVAAERKQLRERTEHVMLRVQLMLSQHGSAVAVERAQQGLQVALELSSADEGFVLMAHGGSEPIARLGSAPPTRELIAWAQQSMLDAAEDEETAMTSDIASEVDTSYKLIERTRYGVVPLWARHGGQDRVVAALVLGFDNQVPRMPEPAVMQAIAKHLAGDSST